MDLQRDFLRQIASEAITSKCWQLQEDIQENNISLTLNASFKFDPNESEFVEQKIGQRLQSQSII